MSDTKNLATALAAFQAELPKVTLDGTNPHFKSKFASLANMSHVVLPALAKHGLAFTAAPRTVEGRLELEAALMHSSGEKLTATLPISAGKPQDVGSALTYYRRYALAALTGVVADDDDDGNTAQAAKPVQAPAEWRSWVATAASQDDLNAVYQRASAEGWATPDVLAALTARKEKLNEQPADSAATE